MKKSNFELKRININLSVDTIKKVKEYAFENGISATAAYSLLINKGLNVESLFDKFEEEMED